MFTEIVSPIFLIDCSSFLIFLLPTLLEEKFSKGVNHLGNLLASRYIISLGFKGLSYTKGIISSPSENTCQESKFLGR